MAKTDEVSLKDYVKSTLVQLVMGVKEAQDEKSVKATNARIAPTGIHYTPVSENVVFVPGRGLIQRVEFDVAISSSKTKTGGAKAGINVTVVEARIGGELDTTKTTENRVKFTVPVLFPSEFFDWDKELQKKKKT